MCGGMINVVNCFAVGAWQAGRIPSSVFMSFSPVQQKLTFKIMANRIRFGNEQHPDHPSVGLQGLFLKVLTPEAKNLAQRAVAEVEWPCGQLLRGGQRAGVYSCT
jgi:hypothetical protein